MLRSYEKLQMAAWFCIRYECSNIIDRDDTNTNMIAPVTIADPCEPYFTVAYHNAVGVGE